MKPLYIEFNYFETDKNQMRGFISRQNDKFVCNVFVHTGFDTDDIKVELNRAMKNYIENKINKNLNENNFVWEDVKFKFTEERFPKIVKFGFKVCKKNHKQVLNLD